MSRAKTHAGRRLRALAIAGFGFALVLGAGFGVWAGTGLGEAQTLEELRRLCVSMPDVAAENPSLCAHITTTLI